VGLAHVSAATCTVSSNLNFASRDPISRSDPDDPDKMRSGCYIVNYSLCVGRCIQAVLLVKELAQKKTSMHALSAENLTHQFLHLIWRESLKAEKVRLVLSISSF